MLDLCREYSIDPLRMDEIPDDIKILMIAKWRLESERNKRYSEK